jgi:hypothetical protein
MIGRSPSNSSCRLHNIILTAPTTPCSSFSLTTATIFSWNRSNKPVSKMLHRHRLARMSRRLTQTPWRHTRSMATLLGSNHDPTDSADPSGYCKVFIRRHDYESFLISQFYPKEMQGGYFALKAFYVSLRNHLNTSDDIYLRGLCEG